MPAGLRQTNLDADDGLSDASSDSGDELVVGSGLTDDSDDDDGDSYDARHPLPPPPPPPPPRSAVSGPTTPRDDVRRDALLARKRYVPPPTTWVDWMLQSLRPPEALYSDGQKGTAADYWDNYDLRLSNAPKLMEDDQWEAAKTINGRGRAMLARKEKNRRQTASDDKERNGAATAMQGQFRTYNARKKYDAKRGDTTADTVTAIEYEQFKAELRKGIRLFKYSRRAQRKVPRVLSIDKTMSKLIWTPPMLGRTMRIATVHHVYRGQRTRSFRDVPRDRRGVEECCFSLVGVRQLNFEVASIKLRNFYASGFQRLVNEFTTPASAMYLDADGNAKRVSVSVFDRPQVTIEPGWEVTDKNSAEIAQIKARVAKKEVKKEVKKEEVKVERIEAAKDPLDAYSNVGASVHSFPSTIPPTRRHARAKEAPPEPRVPTTLRKPPSQAARSATSSSSYYGSSGSGSSGSAATSSSGEASSSAGPTSTRISSLSSG